MSALKPLLRIARVVLYSVSQEIRQQTERLFGEVMAPIEEAVKLVVSGEVWRGNDADRFVEEAQHLLPDLRATAESLNALNKNIVTAQDVFDEADQRAERDIANLTDTFNRI